MSVQLFGNELYNIPITNIPGINSAKTISMWINTASFTASTWSTFNIYCNPSQSNPSAIQIGCRADGKIGTWNFGGTYLVSATAPSVNVWFHYTYTHDGNKAHQLFLNGVLSTSASTSISTNTTYAVTIGNNYWSEAFSGYLEDIRIYNRVLAANEIQSIYSIRGADYINNGLIGQWTCVGTKSSAASTLKNIGSTTNVNDAALSTGSPLFDSTYLKSRYF